MDPSGWSGFLVRLVGLVYLVRLVYLVDLVG
jgi:hypothetical protein